MQIPQLGDCCELSILACLYPTLQTDHQCINGTQNNPNASTFLCILKYSSNPPSCFQFAINMKLHLCCKASSNLSHTLTSRAFWLVFYPRVCLRPLILCLILLLRPCLTLTLLFTSYYCINWYYLLLLNSNTCIKCKEIWQEYKNSLLHKSNYCSAIL